MRHVSLISALVMMIFAASAYAGLDGHVYFTRVDGDGFESHGEAAYVDALSRIDYGVPLGGTHSVHGAYVFETRIQTYGRYFYIFEGPTEPGACYGTTLYVTADPPGDFNSTSQTWRGDTKCAPARPGTIQISQLCPLILDINGDGIHTTGLEWPVHFWTFAGVRKWSGWTHPATEEAFLWLDADSGNSVDEAELFGSRMPAPDGGLHRNGFQALEKYDDAAFGGNGDGWITVDDRVWGRLRLWIDRDHDGAAGGAEIVPPSAFGIVAVGLLRVHDHREYENGNGLMLAGSYLRRTGRGEIVERAMVDIGFTYAP
ncbi:MAG TPA: hypothetical protein VHK90_15180 [Thermoanaerobaculia bacterium]|nr:hypothetical protein [Thermoanaerobaculia bacterium]